MIVLNRQLCNKHEFKAPDKQVLGENVVPCFFKELCPGERPGLKTELLSLCGALIDIEQI